MARVPVDELVMDYDYQRVETKTVADLVRHWQDEKCAPLVVNYRPDKDKFYVIDGGHRLTAAKRLHISLLPCKILIGKTKQEEARIFADQQKDVAVLTPYDRYKAALVAKDAMALKLQSIFDKYNIKVLKYPYATSGAIRCLAYCWQMVNESKAETLDEMFYQALRRCYRFGQENDVDVWIVISKQEGNVLANVQRKEDLAKTMIREMTDHTREILEEEIRGLVRTSIPYNPTIEMKIPIWVKGDVA